MSDTITTTIEKLKLKFKVTEKCSICSKSFIPLEIETHTTNCNYYDSIILQKRSAKYQRHKTIKKFVKNHALGNCNCKKTGKHCNYEKNELYPILYKVKEAYLSSDIEGDTFVEENISFFETTYNCSQSITQSLKCCAGKAWEDSFEETLEMAGFKKGTHFASQVNIDNNGFFQKKKKKGTNTGHKLDFVIPVPKFGTNITDHSGYIISNKTTTRERVHQDKFLGKFVLVTTQDFQTDDTNITVITPKNNDNQFTRFMMKLLTEYQLL